MLNLFFKKDPIITWSKVFCPVCGNPTGPQSDCYKEEDTPKKQKKKIVHPQLGIIPVYTLGCVFRQENLYEATLNYPVSKPLLNKLADIQGVEKIFPTKTYTFQVSIGKSFDDKDIRRQITIAYKTFIKEIQALESNKINYDIYTPLYTGVVLPNGKNITFTTVDPRDLIKNDRLVDDLMKYLPGSSGVKNESKDKE